MLEWLPETIAVLSLIFLIGREINRWWSSRQIEKRFEAAERKFDAAERTFDVALRAKDSQIEALREQHRHLESLTAPALIREYEETIAGFDSVLERSRNETSEKQKEIEQLKQSSQADRNTIETKEIELKKLSDETKALAGEVEKAREEERGRMNRLRVLLKEDSAASAAGSYFIWTQSWLRNAATHAENIKVLLGEQRLTKEEAEALSIDEDDKKTRGEN